jgi:glycosyltransferase involved in cell wall biosynthesis
MRLAWVLYGLPGGGVGSVCHNAASAVAALTDHRVSLVVSHRCASDYRPPAGVELHSLQLSDEAGGAVRGFHEWLQDNPQDVVFLNDDAMLEPYLPHVPRETATAFVVHDDGRRYVRGALRHRRHLDAVVVVSHYLEGIVRPRLGEFPGIIATIQSGCAFPEARPRVAAARPLELLFIGRLDGLVKGAADIPAIMRALGDAGFRGALSVVGGRDERLEAACRRAAPGIDVRWHGRTPHAECLRLAGEHDVLLMLSRKEAFGMVTVEAMGMGCVPIAYDAAGGSQEIIDAGQTGLLVPLGDHAAMAGAIVSLDADRDRLARMANAAMARARSAFSAERMGRGYASLAGELCATPPARRCRLPFDDFRARPARRNLYQRLPAGVRSRIRALVGRSPRLSHLLRRWHW